MYRVETEEEVDGRWIAEVVELPGVLAYGATRDEAVRNAQRLALQALAERFLNHEVLPPGKSHASCRVSVMLIETRNRESDADLRTIVDGILNTLNPEKPNWWHPYELRGVQQYEGKLYREF